MIVHPRLRALRADDSPQRHAQDALGASLANWRARPEVAEMLTEVDRFAGYAPLADCPALAALFRPRAPQAMQLAESFAAAMAGALAAAPLGHVPLRHSTDGKCSTLVLARQGNASLLLITTASDALEGRPARAGVSFAPGESWEHVLAGSAAAETVECCLAGARTAVLDRRAIALTPGTVLCLDGERQALRLRAIGSSLVSLRLHRRPAKAGASREYDLATGELIHQAAGNPRDSRIELILAMLGRMGRTDAVPAMAAIALGEGSDALRWQALRECLALDTGEGFAALCAVARRADDPLAGPAGRLRKDLLARHPELAGIVPCPA